MAPHPQRTVPTRSRLTQRFVIVTDILCPLTVSMSKAAFPRIGFSAVADLLLFLGGSQVAADVIDGTGSARPLSNVCTQSAPSEGLEESESLVLRVLRVEHFCEGSSVEQDMEVERRVQPKIVRKPQEMVHLCATSSPTHRCQSLRDVAASSFLWTNAWKPTRKRRWTRRCQDQDGDLGKVRKHVLAEHLKRLVKQF